MTRNNLRVIFLSLLMVLSVVAVGATPAAAQQEGEVDIVLEPTEDEVQPGQTATYDLVVEGNDASFEDYQATVNISDTSVGTITDFSHAMGGFSDTNIADDNSSVFVANLFSGGAVGDSSVTVGTVTVTAADAEGSTSLSVTNPDPGGDRETLVGTYDLNNLGSADLTVAQDEPNQPGDDDPNNPEYPNLIEEEDDEGPAQDLDGDGFPEDVNGDDAFNVRDIRHLFRYFI